MKVYRSLDENIKIPSSSCAIGMFDGVHAGHNMVLEQAIRVSKINNLASIVFTFANHPQSLISQTPTPLLSTLDERLKAFGKFHFDAALVLDFTPELRDMAADDFVQTILLDTLHVKAVSIGYDHRFGKDRKGDGAFLKAKGKLHGFEVFIVEPVKIGNQIVSSTVIRKLLSYGDLDKANRLLEYPYSITGRVVPGIGRGRMLGFPTANLEVAKDRLIPAQGVYAGTVKLEKETLERPALCNIGVSPTFADQTQVKIEVHLLDPTDSLYGKTVTFYFLHHLREEKAFPTTNELIAQLEKDCSEARKVFPGRVDSWVHEDAASP